MVVLPFWLFAIKNSKYKLLIHKLYYFQLISYKYMDNEINQSVLLLYKIIYNMRTRNKYIQIGICNNQIKNAIVKTLKEYVPKYGQKYRHERLQNSQNLTFHIAKQMKSNFFFQWFLKKLNHSTLGSNLPYQLLDCTSQQTWYSKTQSLNSSTILKALFHLQGAYVL